MVEVPEIMIHYPYIRILSRYAIREKVTAGGKLRKRSKRDGSGLETPEGSGGLSACAIHA